MEIRIECIIPLLIINNSRMKVTTSANVLQHNEFRVKQSRQTYLYLENGYGENLFKVQM